MIASCFSNSASFLHGRIAANPVPDWNLNSVLRSISSGNWFQQNGWRELVHYEVSARCATGTSDCGGSGPWGTVNNPVHLPANNKQFVIIATGSSISPQIRTSLADKSSEANYLEDENLTLANNLYVRTSPTNDIVNDRVESLP